MVGYLKHNDVSIRVRSGGFDVPVGAAPFKGFVVFEELADAKAFIDAGRNTAGHVVYDMQTQTPVNN